MKESGSGKPGEKRSILNRIPAPVSTPAQDGIGPMGSQSDAAGQKQPSDHGPAAGDVNPFFSRGAHHQRSQRKSKKDGGTDLAPGQPGGVGEQLLVFQPPDWGGCLHPP